MRRGEAICVKTKPGDLKEGLFGGIFLFVLEILPYLKAWDISPSWSITSRLYGDEPDFVVIPGILDPTKPTGSEPGRTVSLGAIRKRHSHVLGNDWGAINALWSSFFSIPERVVAAADALGDLGSTLGLHYRGNDKNTSSFDTNPVSHADFSAVVNDFLKRPNDIKRLFVATDDAAFIDHVRGAVNLEVVSLGAGAFHRTLPGRAERMAEADRALLDCLILSRCAAVLNTSSALSAFAKMLNPDLPIRRCAASKMFADIPYWPIAYIPAYETQDPAVAAILERTLAGDWTTGAAAEKFRGTFASRPRWPLRSAVWSAPDRLADRAA